MINYIYNYIIQKYFLYYIIRKRNIYFKILYIYIYMNHNEHAYMRNHKYEKNIRIHFFISKLITTISFPYY